MLRRNQSEIVQVTTVNRGTPGTPTHLCKLLAPTGAQGVKMSYVCDYASEHSKGVRESLRETCNNQSRAHSTFNLHTWNMPTSFIVTFILRSRNISLGTLTTTT